MDCISNERKRILVVEDDPDICMVYKIVLEDAGFECFPYSDSVKALQEFKPYLYDLILLDIKMPLLNGFDLCKRIMEVDKRLDVIFITAGEEYYEEFRKQSYHGLNNNNIKYIQKPVENEQLVQIVNEALGLQV